MTKVYIERQGAPELTPSLAFWPNFRFTISPKLLFRQEIAAQYQTPFFEIVSEVSRADFVAVPHEYFEAVQYAPEYLERVFALAKTARKKVLLFDYSDFVETEARIPADAVLFRISAYRHHKKQNELVMPYFVEDMGVRYGIAAREKGDTGIVGYCGQSKFGSPWRRLRARVKRLAQSALLRLRRDPYPAAHERGVFWRARALSLLRRAGVATSFIERPFYSLHRFSAPLDPATLRREFVENLRGCALALCVRGDANASQRFFEALSASRIPLFLDTDCSLPLEEIIDYDRVMLRVPARELALLPARVREWWSGETPESFLAMEHRAREVYETYLRLDRFFAIVFDREKSPYRQTLFQIV